MGLADWFKTFCSNILVSDKDIITSRYKQITKRLNTDFWDSSSELTHSLYIGSYGRNTAIKGVSDIDICFELPSSVYHKYDKYSSNGQSALLQAVKNSLLNTYPCSYLNGDGQVVDISFYGGMIFEILPVFLNKSGTYTFPDSNNGGSWKTTNPKNEIEAIRGLDHLCNGNLINLCRMMRSWKNQWDVKIKGFLIDTLAYRFLSIWEFKDKSYLYYDYMCRDFFAYLMNQDKTKYYWLAPGSNQYVYCYNNFQIKAKKCYDLAIEAIDYETSSPKKEWSAKQKWRQIFGTEYPS